MDLEKAVGRHLETVRAVELGRAVGNHSSSEDEVAEGSERAEGRRETRRGGWIGKSVTVGISIMEVSHKLKSIGELIPVGNAGASSNSGHLSSCDPMMVGRRRSKSEKPARELMQ